eukprot:314577-Chlamydomonas_euryale.AAC.1
MSGACTAAPRPHREVVLRVLSDGIGPVSNRRRARNAAPRVQVVRVVPCRGKDMRALNTVALVGVWRMSGVVGKAAGKLARKSRATLASLSAPS